jgi:hypothetical protein
MRAILVFTIFSAVLPGLAIAGGPRERRALEPGATTSIVFPNGDEISVSCGNQSFAPICRIMPAEKDSNLVRLAVLDERGNWVRWLGGARYLGDQDLYESLRELRQVGQCR